MADTELDTAAGRFAGVDLQSLAEREGTPLYAYSAPAIRARVRALQAALAGLDAGICYAVKACGNGAVLRLLAEEGAGADIVSGGELQRALRAGIPAERIVFSGVGKSDAEIALALDVGIARFNVESRAELDAIQRIASARDVTARASVRINPDVDARTHAKISTGKAENKFGVSIAEARRWFDAKASLPNVRLDGLHMHIGSQLLSLDPVCEALQRMAAFWKQLDAAGHAIASIDVGGGLGVRYRDGEQAPDANEYAAAMRWMASSSARDSALKRAMPACKAIAISASDLPTPENTMRSAWIPARKARCSSPPDTMSAPAPSSANRRSTAPLPLAFTA